MRTYFPRSPIGILRSFADNLEAVTSRQCSDAGLLAKVQKMFRRALELLHRYVFVRQAADSNTADEWKTYSVTVLLLSRTRIFRKG